MHGSGRTSLVVSSSALALTISCGRIDTTEVSGSNDGTSASGGVSAAGGAIPFNSDTTPSGGTKAVGSSYSAGGSVSFGGSLSSGDTNTTASGSTASGGVTATTSAGAKSTVSATAYGGTVGTGGTMFTGGGTSASGGSSPIATTSAYGGTTAIGGTRASGGANATGGTAANIGGVSSTVGTQNTGGSAGTGGATNTGGAITTGGDTSTGGATTTGSDTSTGGAATGGAPPTGGTTATGGAPSCVTTVGGGTGVPATTVLLNEVLYDPKGQGMADAVYQYIELEGSPNGTLANYYVAVVDGRQAAAGDVLAVVDLGTACSGGPCALGCNGLLMITPSATTGQTTPAGTTRVASGYIMVDTTGNGNPENDISILVLGSTAAITMSTQLDPTHRGTLALPSGTTFVDGIGWRETTTGIVYGVDVKPNTAAQVAPAGIIRVSTNTTPLDPNAWFYGAFPSNGTGATVTFDPATIQPTVAGAALPAGVTSITPGLANIAL